MTHMYGRSLIDDVKFPSTRSKDGYPILFSNAEIRLMMRLAKVGKDDIFYDLGSGWGQNVLIALTEFRVKAAIGIEDNLERWKKSNIRLRRWRSHYAPQKLNGKFIKANFHDFFLEDRKKILEKQGARLLDATVVFYGLGTDRKLANELGNGLTDGCRLIYYYDCLFPEILPSEKCHPFFLSVQPFAKPKSKLEWLKAVTGKTSSSFKNRIYVDEPELWEELTHDYRWENDKRQIKSYQKRLNKVLSR